METKKILFLLASFSMTIAISESRTCMAQCDYSERDRTANCSSMNLDCIPINFPNAAVMDLSNNNITELSFGDFDEGYAEVTEIYLDNNGLRNVETLALSERLPRLHLLSLKGNMLSDSLSFESMCSYPYFSPLRELYLDNNNLPSLPESCLDSVLTIFSVNFNTIFDITILKGEELPAISCEHSQVRNFELSGAVLPNERVSLKLGYNQITQVSINVDQLPLDSQQQAHFELYLQRNPLTQLHSSWTPHTLNIDSTGFRSLTEVNMFFPGCRFLYARNNSFTTLHPQPGWARDLQYLNVDFNRIYLLSTKTLQGYAELREFHLANNGLTFISPSALNHLTKLESLYLDNNELTSLYGGIFLKQVNLVSLSLTNNKLTSFASPGDFIGLAALETLRLSANQLETIQFNVFRGSPKLHTLDISENSLTSFDPGAGPNVTDLGLTGNPLHCDCKLRGLRAWLINHRPLELPRCNTPSLLTGRLLNDTTERDLGCVAPKATTSSSREEALAGQNALLTCQASGVPEPNLSWLSPNDTEITNGWQDRFFILRSKNLMIVSTKQEDEGEYTCSILNEFEQEDAVSVTLKINTEPPEPSIGPLPPAPQTNLVTVVLPVAAGSILATIIVIALGFILYRRSKPRQRKYEAQVSFKSLGKGATSKVKIEDSQYTTPNRPTSEDSVSNSRSLYQELLKNQDGQEQSGETANVQAADNGVNIQQEHQNYEALSEDRTSEATKPVQEDVYVNKAVVARQLAHMHPVHDPHRARSDKQAPGISPVCEEARLPPDAAHAEGRDDQFSSSVRRFHGDSSRSGVGEYAYAVTETGAVEHTYAETDVANMLPSPKHPPRY